MNDRIAEISVGKFRAITGFTNQQKMHMELPMARLIQKLIQSDGGYKYRSSNCHVPAHQNMVTNVVIKTSQARNIIDFLEPIHCTDAIFTKQ